MDTETDFWCGSLNGMHVVYDPKIQVPGSRWVLLYQVRRNGLIPYTKAHARSVMHPISDPESSQGALKAYENWRRTVMDSILADAESDIRRKDEYLEKRVASRVRVEIFAFSQSHRQAFPGGMIECVPASLSSGRSVAYDRRSPAYQHVAAEAMRVLDPGKSALLLLDVVDVLVTRKVDYAVIGALHIQPHRHTDEDAL